MKLEQILEMWDKDSKIDRTNLGEEALNIPSLHAKYYRILVNEKLVLRKYEEEMKVLKFDKYEFFTEGPNEESINRGWKLPARGRILKNEVSSYIESDSDIIKLSLKIGIQHEKVGLLESIIKTIGGNSFNIRNAIEYEKFKLGM